jgi:hypothetical protein
MSAHNINRAVLVGVSLEVFYRLVVRKHVRGYLGIETS